MADPGGDGRPSAMGGERGGWRFDAAIFDLDGVVTDTARVHAKAWKRLFDDYLRARGGRTGEAFQPFDMDADYARYVDGKPRYEGVASFLESRGIDLAWGEPSDPPDRESVCGLGNKKNLSFRESLRAEPVEVFEGAVALLRRLRAMGVKTAMVSSSRNAIDVLDAADLSDHFDVRIDGEVAEARGLKGKPAPDTFLAAARDLGVEPNRAIVLEDAISGVEAARAGGFALVVGVDRTGQREKLETAGADVVVGDPGDLDIAALPHAARPVGALRDAIKRFDEIASELDGRRAAVFLDYDGTLTPIVARPDLAVLSDAARAAVRALAEVCTVGIVSGRDRADVERLIGIQELIYAGSHGFDISGPDGLRVEHEAAREHRAAIERASERLRERLASVDGTLVEPKAFAVAAHYRQVAEADVAMVASAVDDVVGEVPGLKKTLGKKVFELRPAIDWDKGRAILWILEALGIDGPDILPIYLGDDVTDEDAFAALSGRGLAIVVGRPDYPTLARYVLDDPDEVRRFLVKVAHHVKERRDA